MCIVEPACGMNTSKVVASYQMDNIVSFEVARAYVQEYCGHMLRSDRRMHHVRPPNICSSLAKSVSVISVRCLLTFHSDSGARHDSSVNYGAGLGPYCNGHPITGIANDKDVYATTERTGFACGTTE